MKQKTKVLEMASLWRCFSYAFMEVELIRDYLQGKRYMVWSFVEYATEYSREDMRFTFKNGMEIKA